MKYTFAEFKERYGRNWKAKAQQFWLQGIDLGPEMQSLRNAGLLKKRVAK